MLKLYSMIISVTFLFQSTHLLSGRWNIDFLHFGNFGGPRKLKRRLLKSFVYVCWTGYVRRYISMRVTGDISQPLWYSRWYWNLIFCSETFLSKNLKQLFFFLYGRNTSFISMKVIISENIAFTRYLNSDH